MEKVNSIFSAVLGIFYKTYKILTAKLFYIPLFTLVIASSVYWFACNYRIQNPVLLGFRPAYVKLETPQMWSPVAEAKEIESVEKLTDIEVIEQYRLATALKAFYTLESSQGKNDGCKEQGMFNGFGFRQNSSEFKCYPTFEAVAERVNEWLEERLSVNGNNLIEAACYYNKGIPNMESCGDYSANFMSVLVDNL